MEVTSKKKVKNSVPPQTEIDLKNLQNQYLKDKNNQEVLNKFFLLLRNYARSVTLKEIKRKSRKGNFYLPPERVDEISTDATLLLLDQYNKEGWKVDVSFAGVLYWKVCEAMYSQADDEKASSLNHSLKDEDKDSKEIIDLVSSGAHLPWELSTNLSIIPSDDPSDRIVKETNVSYNIVLDVIDEAYEILPFKTFIRFIAYLVIYFRKPKTRNIQKLFNTLFLTSKEENAFDILLLEIRNRISEHAF